MCNFENTIKLQKQLGFCGVESQSMRLIFYGLMFEETMSIEHLRSKWLIIAGIQFYREHNHKRYLATEYNFFNKI